MHAANLNDTVPTPFLLLNEDELEDEREEAERQDFEAKERGEEKPDLDLEKQRRLNKH